MFRVHLKGKKLKVPKTTQTKTSSYRIRKLCHSLLPLKREREIRNPGIVFYRSIVNFFMSCVGFFFCFKIHNCSLLPIVEAHGIFSIKTQEGSKKILCVVNDDFFECDNLQ